MRRLVRQRPVTSTPTLQQSGHNSQRWRPPMWSEGSGGGCSRQTPLTRALCSCQPLAVAGAAPPAATRTCSRAWGCALTGSVFARPPGGEALDDAMDYYAWLAHQDLGGWPSLNSPGRPAALGAARSPTVVQGGAVPLREPAHRRTRRSVGDDDNDGSRGRHRLASRHDDGQHATPALQLPAACGSSRTLWSSTQLCAHPVSRPIAR